jgi:hypothetical protein
MVGIGASFAKINTSFTQKDVSTAGALGEAMAHTTEFKTPAEKKAYIENHV